MFVGKTSAKAGLQRVGRVSVARIPFSPKPVFHEDEGM